MLHILIIDDEESIRTSLQIHLTNLGYTVETAVHPLEVRCVQQERCQAEGPFADVILVDQVMPHMTGLEFLAGRTARGCKGNTQHLALMSANLGDDEVRQAENLDCRVFHKPFNLGEVEKWLQEIEAGR